MTLNNLVGPVIKFARPINFGFEFITHIDFLFNYFNNRPYQIIEGHLRIVEHTNLAYVEPHKVIIGDTLYLFFNEQKHFYIGNLKKKIPIDDLSEYIARH